MPAQLLSLSDGPSILLDKPILLIGRHPECDVQIDSRKVSRRHCCVAQVGDYLIVRDLGSTNGIRINGVRVLEGKLKEHDELTIGGNRYQVSWEASPARPLRSRRGPARKPEPQPGLPSMIPEEDDLLEACEEPVPLAEPVEPGPRMPEPDLPTADAARSQSRKPDHAPAGEKPPSRIIPENLNLAPGSELDMDPPRRPVSGE